MRRRELAAALGAPLFAQAQTKSFAAVWRDNFLNHWKDTRDYTLAVLEAMPEDGFGLKPNPAQRPFGEQLRHLASANVVYFRAFNLLPVPDSLPLDREVLAKQVDPLDKAAVRKYVAASFEYVAAVLGKLSEKDLARTDLALFKGAAPHSTIDVCMRAYMHTAHHRGQAVVYLRVKGITPPAWKFEPKT